MASTPTTRILLFTGKGGVGKTTFAAATALRAAKTGLRTLVLSTDPAHSLSDALDKALGPEPKEILPNLDAMEVDLFYSMETHFKNLRKLLLKALEFQGINRVASEEMAALPGMEEAAALFWLDDFYQQQRYDLIIIDSAPTGETLTFLTLPQTMQWWFQRAFPFQRATIMNTGAWVRTLTNIPLDKGYEELEHLYKKLERVQTIMSTPATCSIRIVVNPERMVLREAQRAYTYLQVYGYPVDAVMVNRILPDTMAGTLFGDYLETQQAYLHEIEDSFAPLPVFRAPHMGREVYGLKLLERIGNTLYGDKDPAQIFCDEPTYKLEQDGENSYILEIRTPFLSQADVEVRHHGDELTIQAKNRQRIIFLPKFLAYYQLEDFSVTDSKLRIRFSGSV